MKHHGQKWILSDWPCKSCGGEVLYTYCEEGHSNKCPHCLQGECARRVSFCRKSEIVFPVEHVNMRAMT